MKLQAWKACVLSIKDNVSETNVTGLDLGAAMALWSQEFYLTALRLNFPICEQSNPHHRATLRIINYIQKALVYNKY